MTSSAPAGVRPGRWRRLGDAVAVWARNPILHRELVTSLRTRRSFGLLAAWLTCTIGVVLLAWPKDAGELLVQGEIAREVVRLFVMTETVLLVIIVPAIVAPSLSSERERGTLDLLLTTPLSAEHVVAGKLCSGLAYVVLLLLVSLPVVLCCELLGGVSAGSILGLYALLFGQALLFGLVSILLSIVCRRTHLAVVAGIGAAAVIAVVIAPLHGFDGDLDWSSPALLLAVLALLAACYWLHRRTVRRLARMHEGPALPSDPPGYAPVVGLIVDRQAWPDKWVVPRRPSTSFRDDANAVYQKEARTDIYGVSPAFVRFVIQASLYLSLVFLGWVLIAEDLGGAQAHGELAYQCFVIGYVMLLGPTLAAGAFTREKEQGTHDALILTTLPRWEIVIGKFTFLVRVVAGLALLNAVCFVELLIMGEAEWSQALVLVVGTASTLVVVVALGCWLSVRMPTTLSTTITGHAVLGVIFLGPLFVKSVLGLVGVEVSGPISLALRLSTPFLACTRPAGLADQLLVLGGHASLAFLVAAGLLVSTARTFERRSRT